MDKPEFTPPKLPDEKRRILVRGALAAPIVLGTLASKQALATGAHHHCTVSGKWSGGSTHGTPPTCRTGKSCKEVQLKCRDGGGHQYIKGNCTKRNYYDSYNRITYRDKIHFDRNNDGTTTKQSLWDKKFKDLFQCGDDNHFYRIEKTVNSTKSWEMCRSNVSGRREMSTYEVLHLDKNCTDDTDLKSRAESGREFACALYNATFHRVEGYPLSVDQVKGMANDCLLYGSLNLSKHFNVSDASQTWTTDECVAYLKEIRNWDEYC